MDDDASEIRALAPLDGREYAYDWQSRIGKLDKAWDDAVKQG